MELRDIEIFLTLADLLHFGRTAERLYVSVARVSQAIRPTPTTCAATGRPSAPASAVGPAPAARPVRRALPRPAQGRDRHAGHLAALSPRSSATSALSETDSGRAPCGGPGRPSFGG
ncbi:helix-turn-helix domain-containing protein [Nonomuraea dietziae]|uniref:helix-turn-helix domain-containing protein n=1 Tax=Nonomuraea dietziae TaxID=65515 RepID=UPI0033F46BE4